MLYLSTLSRPSRGLPTFHFSKGYSIARFVLEIMPSFLTGGTLAVRVDDACAQLLQFAGKVSHD